MTDPPHHPEPGDDGGMRYDDESTTGIPRWVKVTGIIVAVVALLVVIVLLVGDGHGPRRHGSGGAGGQAPPDGVIEVHVPPDDGPQMTMAAASARAARHRPIRAA